MRILFFLLMAACLHANACREMIILMDSRGTEENIGRPTRCYLLNKLQSAIQEQACPILVSPPLWEAFLEKRESIRQMGVLPDTAEKQALEIYKRINERLNFWYRHYRDQQMDPIQSKQLMLARINEEFYANEGFLSDKSNRVSEEINLAMMSYITSFCPENWEGYTSDGSLLLLVPKDYEQRKGEPVSVCTPFTPREVHLGLKVDHLVRVSDLENPSLFYFCKLLPSSDFSNRLSDFFITKDECPLSHSWNLVLSGHGAYFFSGSSLLPVDALVADLEVEEFRKSLGFFERKISTQCLYYATCYGAGTHMKKAFGQDSSFDYSYTIISDVFADSYSYTLFDMISFPRNKERLLSPNRVSYDKLNGWHLHCDCGYQWQDFFQDLSQNSFDDDSLSWVAKTHSHITPSLLCTTPRLCLPHTDKFMIVLPDTYFRITDLVLSTNQKDTLVLSEKTEAVLLESTNIPIPIQLEHSLKIPRIVSAIPGSSCHFVKQLTLKTNDRILGAFWPLDGDPFDRRILIDQLDIPSNGVPFPEIFGQKTETFVLKNVLIVSEKSTLRIFFQTEAGKSYMAVANKADPFNSDASLKGFYPLDDESAKLYLQRYHQHKSEVLSN